MKCCFNCFSLRCVSFLMAVCVEKQQCSALNALDGEIWDLSVSDSLCDLQLIVSYPFLSFLICKVELIIPSITQCVVKLDNSINSCKTNLAAGAENDKKCKELFINVVRYHCLNLRKKCSAWYFYQILLTYLHHHLSLSLLNIFV